MPLKINKNTFTSQSLTETNTLESDFSITPTTEKKVSLKPKLKGELYEPLTNNNPSTIESLGGGAVLSTPKADTSSKVEPDDLLVDLEDLGYAKKTFESTFTPLNQNYLVNRENVGFIDSAGEVLDDLVADPIRRLLGAYYTADKLSEDDLINLPTFQELGGIFNQEDPGLQPPKYLAEKFSLTPIQFAPITQPPQVLGVDYFPGDTAKMWFSLKATDDSFLDDSEVFDRYAFRERVLAIKASLEGVLFFQDDTTSYVDPIQDLSEPFEVNFEYNLLDREYELKIRDFQPSELDLLSFYRASQGVLVDPSLFASEGVPSLSSLANTLGNIGIGESSNSGLEAALGASSEDRSIFNKKNSNIVFSDEYLEDLSSKSSMRYGLPYFTEIYFNKIRRNSQLASIFELTGVNRSLMEYAIFSQAASESTLEDIELTNTSNQGIFGSFISDEFSEGPLSGDFLLSQRAVRNKFTVFQGVSFSLDDWARELASSRDDVENYVEENALVFSEESEIRWSEKSLRKFLNLTSLRAKVSSFLKQNSRSYLDVLEGKASTSEVLYYRVTKHKFIGKTVSKTPLQSFYFNTREEAQEFVLVDPQILLHEKYKYIIHQGLAVIGMKYRYEDWEDLEFRDQDIANGIINLSVVFKSHPKIIEIPVFEKVVHTEDSPPVNLDISFFPYQNSDNKILITMNTLTGSEEKIPQYETPQIGEIFRRVSEAQGKNLGDPILFEADDSISRVEIYRSLNPPDIKTIAKTKYKTFNFDDIREFRDTISPNEKYFYVFRVIDFHGNYSNFSDFYVITSISDNDFRFLEIDVVPFPGKEKEGERPLNDFRKFLHIKPSFLQKVVNFRESGLVNEKSVLGKDIKLGKREESIFGKTLKVRVTSKNTGRKIDLNLNFRQKKV